MVEMDVNRVNGAPPSSGNPNDFLDRTVDFPDGTCFEKMSPVTDFRKDPGEARILYTCRLSSPDAQTRKSETFIMKVKAQWPGPQNLIHVGPSPLTTAELKALKLFGHEKVQGVPHLMTWKKTTQPHDGVHPGGYIIYTIMTKMTGATLWELGYWSMSTAEREEIKLAFIARLKEIRKLGIAPYDCALRNVLWDPATKQVSIVDFEHYHETEQAMDDEKSELQRWGLEQRPPPSTWFQEWGLHK